MAFKQRSSGSFKAMGSSPAKTNPKISLGMGKEADANLSKKVNAKTPSAKNFNTKGGKTTTPGYNTTKAANKGLPKNFNAKGTSKAGKLAQLAKKTLSTNLVSGGKQVLKKAAKVIGGKTLGVAGMLMATSSKADQPTKGKGKKEYEGGKIDFTKKK